MVTRCYEVNGGTCRNLVSLSNNYVCAASHGGGKGRGFPKEAIPTESLKYSEKQALAENPSTLPSILSKLAKDRDINIQIATAINPNTPIDDLCSLYERSIYKGTVEVPIGLAQNPSIGSYLALRLFEDYENDEDVLYFLSENPSTSSKILVKILVRNENLYSQGIARNPSANRKTHIYLAENGYLPIGFTKSKTIDELIAEVSLLDDMPLEFGLAFLERLTNEDQAIGAINHPKTRLLLGYSYSKFAEVAINTGWNRAISKYREKIKTLYPDDQELAEVVGY
jgi:hypothetical protein